MVPEVPSGLQCCFQTGGIGGDGGVERGIVDLESFWQFNVPF